MRSRASESGPLLKHRRAMLPLYISDKYFIYDIMQDKLDVCRSMQSSSAPGQNINNDGELRKVWAFPSHVYFRGFTTHWQYKTPT